MKVDEAFEGVNRIWQEISVIVFVHAVALALAIYANLTSWRTISRGVGPVTLFPELAAFRETLRHVGLDLPFVVAVSVVVYVVLFQRLSAVIVQIPMFRLSYSEPALWRAGKCFDELRWSARWFESYAGSTALEDLQVQLGLSIVEYAKEFQEHHRLLVDARFAAAAVWQKYYSGFCILAVAATVFIGTVNPTKRGLIAPAGLFLAALAARCGWEAQIERAVLGRLGFVKDCAIVLELSRQAASATEPPQPEDSDGAGSTRIPEWGSTNRAPKDVKRRIAELELAAELMKLPPPCLPYQHFWLLHYPRQLKPFKNAGSIAMVNNKLFRRWLANSGFLKFSELPRGDYRLYERIYYPDSVPDDRLIARALRTRTVVKVVGWLAPSALLVDKPGLYAKRPARENRAVFEVRGEPLRKWIARKRVRRMRAAILRISRCRHLRRLRR